MSAPPVLLVHGFASSFERNWREPGWVDLLTEAGREVIELDLPGHGTADKPHEPAAYADLDRVVLEALPSGMAVDAIGFSLGARILCQVASAHPGHFHKIVLAGVGANLFRASDAEPLARAVENGEVSEGDPAAAGAFVRFALGPGNDRAALAACLRRPEHPLSAEDLAGVNVPVLVVLGDKDFAGPADPLVEALPDAKLVTLAGADHFGTAKDVRFIDAALEFLDAVPAWGA